jgi:oligopeptidase B
MTRLRVALAAFLLIPAAAVTAVDPAPTPPVAKPVPHKLELHGETRIDPYYWMRDKTNPEVIEYLKAENAYTAALMKPTEPLQKTLYDEMLGRIQQTDKDVPYRDRGYWYYTRTEEGKQYKFYCRKKGSPDAPEEVMLDANELARNEKYFDVGGFRVSDDGNLLAFATDTTGFREYSLSVKDLRSGKLIEDKFVGIGGVSGLSFEWAADNQTLFYTTEDMARRPYRAWRHTLGQPKDKDVVVFEEKDELFPLMLTKSRDRKYLYHVSASFTSSEQWFLPADQPLGQWRVIAPRQPDHEYEAEHRDGLFYIRTNKDRATNFKVMASPAHQPAPANWFDVLPYDPAVFVEGVALFKNHAVLSVRMEGLPGLVVRDLRTGAMHRVSFPEPAYEVSLEANPEFDTPSVRFTYESLVTPDSEYEYDLTTRDRKLLKRKEVLGGYDPKNYETEWVFAPAADGTKVPVSLVYKKGLKKDGGAPCLLYGYGSYGYSMSVSFDSNRFSLIDRGFVYAQAHVRGGSELGRTWYDDGKMLRKKNTFGDFVAVADFLVRQKHCSRERLAIQGGSAGGLLIGAVLNLRPDLCGCAVLEVPFVDVLTTMSDPDLPLTALEWQQWGDPRVKAHYEYMRSYDPYFNLRKAAYPAMLVMTSLNDSQVLFHEPTKYVARLRTLKTDTNPLLLRCNMEAGHGGASGRYEHLKERALVMAFILEQTKTGK